MFSYSFFFIAKGLFIHVLFDYPARHPAEKDTIARDCLFFGLLIEFCVFFLRTMNSNLRISYCCCCCCYCCMTLSRHNECL